MRGFTLIEILVVLVVAGILLTVLTSFYLSEQRAFRQQQIQVQTSQSLRIALEQIVRDLRIAGRNPTAASGIGLTYAGGTEVRFTLDANDDGIVTATDPDENKGFRRSGSDLETYVASAVGSWQPLAGSMATTGSIFRYWDAGGVELTTLPITDATVLATVRRIDVTLTVTNRVPGAPAIQRTEAATVRLRNLS